MDLSEVNFRIQTHTLIELLQGSSRCNAGTTNSWSCWSTNRLKFTMCSLLRVVVCCQQLFKTLRINNLIETNNPWENKQTCASGWRRLCSICAITASPRQQTFLFENKYRIHTKYLFERFFGCRASIASSSSTQTDFFRVCLDNSMEEIDGN